ncbi:MAG: hypothetical protein VX185_11950 [Pseudomonadota bacterium]|nr:hypothetical protein [Pseudomonadota bacterium]
MSLTDTTSMIKKTALLAGFGLTSLLTACASHGPSAPLTQENLSGSWYGQSEENDGTTLIWVNHRSTEGKFSLTFRKCRGTTPVFFQLKEGHWVEKGSSYITTTTQLSDENQTWQPATPNRLYVEKYDVQYLEGNELHYSNSDESFVAYKVDDSYQLTCGQPPAGTPFAKGA